MIQTYRDDWPTARTRHDVRHSEGQSPPERCTRVAVIGVLRLTLALQAHTIDGPNPFAVLSTKPVIPTRVPGRRICADLADIATRHGVPGHLDRVMIPGPPHSVMSVKLYVVLERFLQFACLSFLP